MFRPMSGRPLHPTFTLADASQGSLLWRSLPSCMDTGAVAGVLDPSRVTGNEEERLQILRGICDEIAACIRAWLAERAV